VGQSREGQIIVGVGGLLRDAACCVIRNGQIASAVDQAKVARQQGPSWFPDESFATALQVADVTADQVDVLAIARPMADGPESSRLLTLRARFPNSEIIVVEHHHAHAASAFLASGFASASVLSVDRAGDYRSALLFHGEGRVLTPLRELYFPDSLGDLFSRVTEFLGYQPRADEHKVQWLSTAGTPRFADVFAGIIGRDAAGWPKFDRRFFDADRMTSGGFSSRFYTALGVQPGEPLPGHVKADVAASLQQAVEVAVALMFGNAQNVCIAGGLALNALLVRSLEQQFARVFVQPASSNAGTALGAALFAAKQPVPFTTLCLGPSFAPDEIKQVLENCKLRFRYLPTEVELIDEAVRALNDSKIVGWMQSRMEFGPRALGNRSILASPLNPYSTENLNIYIKHREAFRKFAASVPAELAGEYFEIGSNAQYLATVGKVKPGYRERFAAAVLGDGLVRVHTVRKEENPLYHSLLLAAGRATGLPILYNTSFNLFGDPLVCTPRDAVRSFYSSGIDMLFAGSFVVEK
jgi:carbamoyltransferase